MNIKMCDGGILSDKFIDNKTKEWIKKLIKAEVQLAKNLLAPVGIKEAASAKDTGIQKKIHGSGMTTSIISNEETDWCDEDC